MIYFIIAIYILILAYYYDILNHKNRFNQWYLITLVIFILLMGFRYRIGVDTIRYMRGFYEDVPLLSEIDSDSFVETRTEPFYLLFTSFVKTVFGRFFYVQLIQAAFVNILIFKYVRKHSRYFFSCIFLYFIWRYFTFTTEEMRAGIAIVITLYANDFALEKKWIKSIALILIAGMFHASAFFLIIIPLLTFLRFNLLGNFFIIMGFFGGLYIQRNFGDLIDMVTFTSQLEQKAAELDNSENSEQVLNIFGIISAFVVYYFYSLYSYLYIKKHDKTNSLLKLEPFVIICIIFVMFSVSINIFYRFVHFYELYVMMFVSSALVKTINLYEIKSRVKLINAVYFIPFYFFVSYTYFISIGGDPRMRTYMRIYPYSSIFDMKLDKNREKVFTTYGAFYYEKNAY